MSADVTVRSPAEAVGPSRRSLLKYVGYGVAATVAGGRGPLGPLAALAGRAGVGPATADAGAGAAVDWVRPDGAPNWLPVRYPLPLPNDRGDAAGDAGRLAAYEVRDALLLPNGFRSTLVAQWGDVFGPPNDSAKQVRFGYAADYTGLAPIAGSADEFWLIVNHEYISGRPWLQGWDQVHAARHGPCPVSPDGTIGGGPPLQGTPFDMLSDAARRAMPAGLVADIRRLCSAALEDLGVSVLRVRRAADGTFAVVKDAPDHLRISGLSAANEPLIAAGKFRFTGPAAALLGTPTGTFSNCSGETTPWGTFLTCEENVQDQVPQHIAPDGTPLPGDVKRFGGLGEEIPAHPGTKLPFEFEGLGTGIERPLDGRQYGWVAEIDPVRRTMAKHTLLGRFRHENVALRVEAGRRLAAYMGDDRRGGHVWKFVSDAAVVDPKDPANSKLLEAGTLYVARLDADFTGRWIPLRPDTPIARPEPEQTADGVAWLPYRPDGGHVLVGAPSAKLTQSSVRRWQQGVERFCGKPFDRVTPGDLVAGPDRQAVILADAYAMANAVGGTPCARPEDVEVHPRDKSVYVAFTDTTGSEDGSPDKRVFPDSAKKNSRQYGAIYRLAEADGDPAADRFTWGKFVSAGEVGEPGERGGGFACADNLVFDPAGHMWMVCDITTPTHNYPVSRAADSGTGPVEKNFLGVFGNNAMFLIPTAGPRAGEPHCFAIGPMESELTGPTFTPDGQTLLLSVQHPGELYGARALGGQPPEEARTVRVADRAGKLFAQARVVPLGRNFPGNNPGEVPRPAVVCIVRGRTGAGA